MFVVLRTETFAKLFFLISCTGLFLYSILAFYTFHTAYTTINQAQKQDVSIKPTTEHWNDVDWDTDLKYILFWTLYDSPISIAEGQGIFTDHRCDYANCYITTNKTLLNNDYTNFDAIVFNNSILKYWKKMNMPQKRSPKQKYIFYSLKSAEENPVCNINADNYFNWTWTYKLSSDIVSPFIEVTNLQGNVVAPKINADWSTNESVRMNDDMTIKIKPKRRAVTVILTDCNLKNIKKREGFLKELQAEFKLNLLEFDIYGCGYLPCTFRDCSKVISKYYFYLVYESSDADDFVTGEVLKAYNHGAIPIIMGGADYRNFLPQGSYINAHSLSADHLAIKIAYIMRHPFQYKYFLWKKKYSIHETEDLKGICEVCANLNDEVKFGTSSVHKHFRKWWYPGSLYTKCIPKGAENIADVLSYINGTDKK